MIELCWSHPHGSSFTTSCRPKTWQAPTWSWASTLHDIEPTTKQVNRRGHPDANEPSAEVQRINIQSNQSGQLTHAVLRLRCRLIPSILRICDWSTSLFHAEMDFHGERPLTTGSRIVIVLDEPLSDNERTNGRDLIAVMMFHSRNQKRVSWTEGLVLIIDLGGFMQDVMVALGWGYSAFSRGMSRLRFRSLRLLERRIGNVDRPPTHQGVPVPLVTHHICTTAIEIRYSTGKIVFDGYHMMLYSTPVLHTLCSS